MEAPEKMIAPTSPLPALVRLGGLAILQSLSLWLATKLLPNIPCNTYLDGAKCQPIAPIEQLIVRTLVALIFLPFAYFALYQVWNWRPEARAFLRWLVRIAAVLIFGYMVLIWGSTVTPLVGRFTNG